MYKQSVLIRFQGMLPSLDLSFLCHERDHFEILSHTEMNA